jgi:hypothetical protein
MKPSVLKAVLVTAFRNRQNILITGAPGIGKSDLTAQAADEAKANLIVSHPVVSDPTDFKGYPFPVGKTHADFLPFGDLLALMKADSLTIMFFDDLGQARPAVQASLMQLVLGGQINGHSINKEHVVFVGATNRATDLAGVQSILEPVKSRFLILELDVDVDDWARWAITSGTPAELVAFIRFRPELLHQFTPSREIKNSPCPRSVAKCGDVIKAGYPEETWHELFTGCCGEGFATELLGFLKIYRSLPDPAYVISHPEKVEIPEDPATLYALTGALAAKATEKNFDSIVRFSNRLPDEFNVRLITDALTRNRELGQTKPYQEWFLKHQDVVI